MPVVATPSDWTEDGTVTLTGNIFSNRELTVLMDGGGGSTTINDGVSQLFSDPDRANTWTAIALTADAIDLTKFQLTITVNDAPGDNMTFTGANALRNRLFGGDGADTLTGGSQDDLLNGGDNNDILTGGAGIDDLDGVAGIDTLNGGAGADVLDGGSGNDFFDYSAPAELVAGETIDGGPGTDMLRFFASGIYHFENLSMVGIEVLQFAQPSGLALVMLSQSQIGAITAVSGSGQSDQIAVTGSVINLSTVVFSSWGPLGHVFIEGTSGVDILTGSDQRDSIDGGSDGADTLAGGAGNDTFGYNLSTDIEAGEFVDGGTGTDEVDISGSISGALSYNFSGATLLNIEAFRFTGGIGSQPATLIVQAPQFAGKTVIGLNGNVNNVIVSVTGAVTNLSGVVFVNWISGEDTVSISGTGAAETIVGTSQADTIRGFGGADVLDGAGGADAMAGGLGMDVYFVDSNFDVITENAGEGTDTVYSQVSYQLGNDVEFLFLTGSANINGFGNGVTNYIEGNSGDNGLDGGAGTDALVGKAGNDLYFVDNVGDVVTEAPGEGADTVFASVTYTLSANVENLVLTGSANVNGTGNALANQLNGNGGNNVLDGGAGADTMIGGLGNDNYVVDSGFDAISENSGEGTDTAFTGVTYILPINVENLVMQGAGGTAGYGNTLANVITGTAGVDVIDGMAGADTMYGYAGNDVFNVDNNFEVINEQPGEGTDTVYSTVSFQLGGNVEFLFLQGAGNINGFGDAVTNFIQGNSGDNGINGGGGTDALYGMGGNDLFIFASGQANGDILYDFAGNGALVGDQIQFVGFGTIGGGATFTQVGVTNVWQIHSGLDAHNEFITFDNAATAHPTDFFFS